MVAWSSATHPCKYRGLDTPRPVKRRDSTGAPAIGPPKHDSILGHDLDILSTASTLTNSSLKLNNGLDMQVQTLPLKLH